MIKYELAKQLKDAGFPQRGKNYEAYYLNAGEHHGAIVDATIYEKNDDSYWQGKLVVIPTLSELIEVCPKVIEDGEDYLNAFTLKYIREEDQKILKVEGMYWCACHENSNGLMQRHLGSTAEEAVAKLWLELQK